jgi:predicted DNA-binding mobile mystery protein A
MTKYIKQLQLEQLDELLGKQGLLMESVRPQRGWIRSIREALGMSGEQLARRVGVTQPTIATLERNEARNKITLESLDRLARGLGCRLVYAVVPEGKKSFSDLVRDRATELARAQLAKVSHTMRLEAQDLSAKKEMKQLDRLINQYLSGSLRKLWQ